MFEIKHLKTLTTLANTGNIRKAAEALFTSQSALSHQIKDLEQRLDKSLFIRNTSPVEFTDAGRLLLNLANEVLPAIERTKQALNGTETQVKTLRLAIACHACFQWLLPVTTSYSEQNKNVEIEFADEEFGGHSQAADILFTDSKSEQTGFIYQEIGQFEVVAVLPQRSKIPCLNDTYITAADFARQTLLTYPLPPEQLDIFTLFLNKFSIMPTKIKQIKNSHVMLQMVAANMGIATLPDWLVSSLTQQSLVQSRRLGQQGVFKTLYAKYDENSEHLQAIEKLLPETIQAFANLYSNS